MFKQFTIELEAITGLTHIVRQRVNSPYISIKDREGTRLIERNKDKTCVDLHGFFIKWRFIN